MTGELLQEGWRSLVGNKREVQYSSDCEDRSRREQHDHGENWTSQLETVLEMLGVEVDQSYRRGGREEGRGEQSY